MKKKGEKKTKKQRANMEGTVASAVTTATTFEAITARTATATTM